MKLSQCAALVRGASLDKPDSLKTNVTDVSKILSITPVHLQHLFYFLSGPAWRVCSEDPPPGVRWRRDPVHGRHAEWSSRRQRQGEDGGGRGANFVWFFFFFWFYSFHLCRFHQRFDSLYNELWCKWIIGGRENYCRESVLFRILLRIPFFLSLSCNEWKCKTSK